jgi:hypothetical protein
MTLGGVITFMFPHISYVFQLLFNLTHTLDSHETYFTFPRDSCLFPARLMLTRPKDCAPYSPIVLVMFCDVYCSRDSIVLCSYISWAYWQ